ncbi:MAG TPA: PIN domain-containing protein [Candidatus Micrarchaeaceae archaeon]|nr:PIN domain-containing protein [Candidatus Micrarchaeaceae archaeon]
MEPTPNERYRRTATPNPQAVYWDASAVLSVVIADVHSAKATTAARRNDAHLLSTLALAEALAVVARLEREGALPAALADAARDVVVNGPWRRLSLQPDWKSVETLAARWPLRGADLWHLATADTLRRELPDLKVITFDTRLGVASQGIGLRVIS